MSTRILITGGAGFIGSNLAERLLNRGSEVLILDNLSRLGAERNPQYLCETYGNLVQPHVKDIRDRRAVADLAAELTAVRGRLVIAGYHQDGPRQVNMQNWKGLDVVNAHERDPQVYVSGMREAIAMAAERVFPLRDILTHSYSLDDLPGAMRDMEERPQGFLKG